MSDKADTHDDKPKDQPETTDAPSDADKLAPPVVPSSPQPSTAAEDAPKPSAEADGPKPRPEDLGGKPEGEGDSAEE